ncbi:hypothetical protein HHK36_011263 [Tetracentron sinense]|uniref:Uncharacterized protein n=1 Tax=Tetracentron sinense TaxID=13715 RepID=A0A834ZBL2_TETSI|nr:hypothetical protein HHK36_011263 [Tetracentron sinense]
MSTDLEFQHGLPVIRLPPIKVRGRRSSDVTEEDGGDNECQTPNSDEHKIPAIQSCPPAPQKKRRVVLCKRKLSELQFFEIKGREKVDSFFRSSFELPYNMTSNGIKRPR